MKRHRRSIGLVVSFSLWLGALACGQPPAGSSPAAPPSQEVQVAPASAAPAGSVAAAPSASASSAALGEAPDAALGNMWGDAVGDAFGAAAVDVVADGGAGFGAGHGRLGGGRGPSLRQGATAVNGRLPPEIIQRVVRQNFGRFRLCYENGLRANPTLEGRVTIKFVIGTKGNVTAASDGGSDLPDQAVVSCAAQAVSSLMFPRPESGIVTVVYPIFFAPGAAAPVPPATAPKK